jgi:hypothetical protein
MSVTMNIQTARQFLNQAKGWIDWNHHRNLPNWQGGSISLDGRFTVDELKALIVAQGRIQGSLTVGSSPEYSV